MVAQPGSTTVSVEEFEHFIALPENRERLFELIQGMVVEKMPTREHGIIALNIGADLDRYLDVHPVGRAAVEARHRPTDDRHNDFLPDVSLVLGDRPVETQGAANYLPDLCVEIKSPRDKLRELSAKAEFYLAHGARMVWLVYPEQRIVEVLTANDRQLLTENATLTAGDLLPGFAIPVSRIFRRLEG
jgi:Uma2 family endonuclease